MSCARCGRDAELAPCYKRSNSDQYHYQCIMINIGLEKPIALEREIPIHQLGEFEQRMVSQHNTLRAEHNAPSLSWSESCANHAKKWVDYLIKLNTDVDQYRLEHDSYKGMGENLYLQMCMSELDPAEAATRVANNWYSELDEYDYKGNQYDYNASHFTQMVWKGSWKIGAAYGQVGRTFVCVVNYWPAGNIQGWFLDNVEKKN